MKKLIAMLCLCVSASLLADEAGEYVGSNKLIIARKNLEQQKEQQKQNARDKATYDKLHAIALNTRPNPNAEPTEEDYKFADEFAKKHINTDFLKEERNRNNAVRKAIRDKNAKKSRERTTDAAAQHRAKKKQSQITNRSTITTAAGRSRNPGKR